MSPSAPRRPAGATARPSGRYRFGPAPRGYHCVGARRCAWRFEEDVVEQDPQHAPAQAPPPKPTKQELQAAYGRTVPDLVRPGLAVLLCGINPSLWSGAVGLHFASPSNRLWPTLHAAGWTRRRLLPHETDEVLAAGLGVTNLVPRATARADELTDDELREGLPRLEALATRVQPRFVAFLGLSSYRVATGERRAVVGEQDRRVGGARVWLLPNPSGLNASWQLPRLAEAYAALREAASSS